MQFTLLRRARPSGWRARVSWSVGFLVALTIAATTVAGAADPQFVENPDPSWGTDGTIRAVEVLADQVWVGGDFSVAEGPNNVGVVPRGNLAVFDLNDGTLRDFRADTNGRIRTIEADGSTVWVGGDFTVVGGVIRERLVAFNALTGQMLPAFTATANGDVNVVHLHDGWLYVGGEFTEINGQAAQGLVRVDPVTGALDPAFRPEPNEEVRAIDSYGDRIYVAGDFTEIGPVGQRLLRVSVAGLSTVNGAPVGPSFPLLSGGTGGGSGGLGGQDGAGSILVSEDGAHIYIGTRANQISKWDRLFGARDWERVAQGDIQSIALDGGNVYVGLHDGFDTQSDGRLLVALDRISGDTDNVNFAPDIGGFWGIRSMVATPQGLVAVGDFGTVNGVSSNGLAIFRPLAGFEPAPSLADALAPAPTPTPTPIPAPTATPVLMPTPTPVAVAPTPTPVVPAPTATPVVPAPTATPVVPAPTATPVVPAPTATPVVPAPTPTPVMPAPTATPVMPAPTATPVVPAPTATPVVPAPTSTPAPQPIVGAGDVTLNVSCLAGNGRLDFNIVNSGAAAATYRIEVEGLTPREVTVGAGDWGRLSITGRQDRTYDVAVFRDGVSLNFSPVSVGCDLAAPAVSNTEVSVVNACRNGFGYLLFQLVNPTDAARGYVIEFEGVPNRSTTAAPHGAAVRAVTGRPSGTYDAVVRVGSVQIATMELTVDC